MPQTQRPEPPPLQAAVDARYAELADYVLQRTEGFVVGGPFTGMRLPDIVAWGNGDVVAKSLGCYEEELHRPLADLLARKPDLVVNVGCAEGYYAVGLARLLPGVRVHAFDLDPEARRACGLAAHLNSVARQLSIGGRCTADRLAEAIAPAERPLAVIDCEGDEIDLIVSDRLPDLARCDLIVECHDFIDPTVSRTLCERLKPSHDLGFVREAQRNPNRYDFLRSLDSLDRWLAMCEFRPMTMHWLVATARR